MTRRIRFTPFLRAGLFAAGVAASPARAADVPFAPLSIITTTAGAASSGVVADVDGDGDSDVVSNAAASVVWHENVAGNGTAWTAHTVGGLVQSSIATADVDGDGDTDLLLAGSNANLSRCSWFENTAGNGTAWTEHVISTSAGIGLVDTADLDGDGDVDVVSSTGGTVQWHENVTGNGTAWTPHTVLTGSSPALLRAADIDGDGDTDIVVGGPIAGIAWAENVAGNGTVWSPHAILPPSSVRSLAVADVDGDGDGDVVSGVPYSSDSRLYWHENVAGNGSVWTLHTITTLTTYLRALAPADVDGDGDLDVVFTPEQPLSGSVNWADNTSGDGTAWTLRTIAASLGPWLIPDAVVPADIDGDGDRDAVTVSAYASFIVWHRNDAIHQSACFAAPPPISTTAAGVQGVAAADVDGDGDADALAALFDTDRVDWHENAAGNGSSWTPRTIATALDQAEAVTPADVDGDGDVDAFSIGYYTGLRWHRNETGAGTTWTGIPIGGTGFVLDAADVDGDGDVDAVGTTNFFDPFVKWYENTVGNGSAWSFRTIALVTQGGPSFGVSAADLDGDGDVDVITPVGVGGPTPALLWFENTVGNGSAWTTRTVSASEGRSVASADVDRDGDLDVVEGRLGGTFWHENLNGSGTLWAAHTVATSSGLVVAALDLDVDGDADVLRAGLPGETVQWSENTAGNGSAWTTHTLLSTAGSGTGVASSDIDGDGSPDVVAATAGDDRVVWFESQAGQFSLAGTDVSPGSAANGDLVPMLRIVATHLGRPGDSDLELATLGLLFEEAAGDPLTSAEANALIENLHIYRDVNGNGNFDPGTDALVATVPTLALVNGIHTVSFPDGDANLQVTLGTPRTYFVVTELTGNASGQTPNEFRVTHLGTGPSASTAEDRTYDIPLRPACPADVSASVGPITPVELLGFSVE